MTVRRVAVWAPKTSRRIRSAHPKSRRTRSTPPRSPNNSIDSGEIVDFGLSNQDVGVLFAQVNADGTLANSSGGVTAPGSALGTYEVDFGRNISSCASVMTQGEAASAAPAAAIMGATDRSGNPEALFATMRTNANAPVDRAFHLVVVC